MTARERSRSQGKLRAGALVRVEGEGILDSNRAWADGGAIYVQVWHAACSTPHGSPHAARQVAHTTADMQHARWHAIRQGGWRGMPCRHSLRGAVCVVVSAEHISDACNVQYHTWHRPGLSPLPHDAIYSSRSPSSAHRRARLCRACTHVHGCVRAPIAWAAYEFACAAHVSALSGSAGERSRRSERDAHEEQRHQRRRRYRC